MAVGGIIGSIRVALGLDTAQFQNGAKEMQGTLGSIGKTLKSFAVGLGAAFSFGAIVKVMQSAIDKADELGKTAQKIGLPVEALSKLEYGARLADVSLEQLSVGVGKLSQALADAAGGKVTDATKSLAAIGVAATDSQGQLRPTEAVIYDIAEAFSHMEDGAGKTALAMNIFGRSGKELIPLLNAGAAGLKESADEAERFGLVIDTKTAKAAEDFNDNLTKLKASMEGLTNKAMVALIDKFVALTDAMVALAKSDATAKFFDELSNRIDTTIKEFNALTSTINTIGGALSGAFEFATTGETPASKELKRIEQGFTATTDSIEKSTSALGGFARNLKIIGEEKKTPAPIIKAPDTEAINAQKKAMREAMQVFDQTTNAVNKYKEDLAQLDFLLAKGTITQQQYNEHVKQLKENFAETTPVVNELGKAISDTFQDALGSVFDDLIGGSFDLLDSLKNIASQITKIFANDALQTLFHPATNPSQGSGGLGGFFKNLLGFASGGTIFPGSGGQDSQLVAFRKSPNERVDITNPGQSLHSGEVVVKNTIINQSSAKVETGQDNFGNPITIIRDQVRDTMRGGFADGEMAARYGLPPIKKRRQ